MSVTLRIATRASELALRRARDVQAMWSARGVDSELVTFRTIGDKRFDEPIPAGSANRAFTRELEEALVRKRADVAVHWYPDLEVGATPGLTAAAVLRREDPRDVLVLNELMEATSLAELPRGTRIGSSSVRCRALLVALYPELEVVHLRGDLPTRLRKVHEGQVHATIVPAAALHRLEVSQRIAAFLPMPEWLPSPGQGAIVLQTRSADAETRAAAVLLDDPATSRDTAAERAFQASLEGGVQSPIGALVINDDGAVSGRTLHGVIVDAASRQILRAALPMDDRQPELVGVRLANELRARGASRILDSLRGAGRVEAPQPD